MLAHELRAPLAPVNTAVELLDAERATDAQQTWARAVLRRHSRYMSEIVDNLLAASLVSVGAIHLTLVATSLWSMIDRAIELAQPDIDRGGHKFALEIAESLYVDADLIQCPLIVSNLLGNAAKYTQYGGHITLTATADGTNVAITVQDDGAGIAANDIEDIFQLFRQTPRPSARSAGGMGLGLTLARRLAEMHGGTLTARSDGLGKGSEFTLTLRQSSPPDVAAAPPTPEHALPKLPLTVLVVDDNRDTADAMAMYFQLSGYAIYVAYSAPEALDIANIMTPDVVLSDIGLPGMDGYALIKELRNMGGFSATLCVAVSGYSTTADRAAAIEAGFDAHIAKPADVAKLEKFVQQLHAEKRTQSKP